MRKRMILLCMLVAVGFGIAHARTFIEGRLASFNVILDRDTPGSLLEILVRATTQTQTGTLVREVDNIKVPLASLSPSVRAACRTCYDSVFDSYSLTEEIPTPTPTATP
jgi:hypothetical protein